MSPPSVWKHGGVLPPSWHLLLFPPRIPESELAVDGYDKLFAPPPPFLKRLWAGAKYTWYPKNPLKIGEEVHQITQLESAETKQASKGEIVTVWMKKDVSNVCGLSVEERRCLVYVKMDYEMMAKGRVRGRSGWDEIDVWNIDVDVFEEVKHADFHETRTVSPTMAFRYSALTFNSHRIHYDRSYARDVEGYEDCLVHGPLTSSLLLALATKNIPQGHQALDFEYRAIKPIFVNSPINLYGRQPTPNANADNPTMAVWVTDEFGDVCMKGTLTLTRT
ncbi:hypothetical protein BC829DRAFT_413590 [Chytridium lagenaria]|nr:hypothetical protein BC829DRAFT_413590 [Chytridium lagenaria]